MLRETHIFCREKKSTVTRSPGGKNEKEHQLEKNQDRYQQTDQPARAPLLPSQFTSSSSNQT